MKLNLSLNQLLLIAIVAHAVILGGSFPLSLLGISLVILEGLNAYKAAKVQEASNEALEAKVKEMFEVYTKEFNGRLASVDSKFAASALFKR